MVLQMGTLVSVSCPDLSCCVSGDGLYYILCNDVMGPLSTLLLSSTKALFAERMYHGGEATAMEWPYIKGVSLPSAFNPKIPGLAPAFKRRTPT